MYSIVPGRQQATCQEGGESIINEELHTKGTRGSSRSNMTCAAY